MKAAFRFLRHSCPANTVVSSGVSSRHVVFDADTAPERRRRCSAEQKLELLAEAFGPGRQRDGDGPARGHPHEPALPLAACDADAASTVWLHAGGAHRSARGAAGATALGGAVDLGGVPGGARVHVMADAPADLVATTLRALR